MIGTTLSHYKITSQIGEGGMGVVYQAKDLTLDRQIALKVLPPDLAGSQERFERFQREAKTLAALDHPNIVHIYSVESAEPDGPGPPIHFLTMQLIEGKQLSEITPKTGMAAEQLVDIATQLADALTAAHARGVTHRDLKPANVMVDSDGRVKVLDFGLAKLRLSDAGPGSSQLPTEAMTQEGLILGTIPYMSPEQIQGKPVDERTDIFSMGVMLHEMAAGQHPFGGETSAAMAGAILRDDPSSVSEVKPDLPESLGAIVKRCMEKDSQQRYESAKELRADLIQLKSSMSAGTAATGAQTKGRTHHPRSAISKISSVVLLALVLVLGAYLLLQRPSPETSRITSIAVLPLQNMTGDPEQEFFADGMTEALTTDLSKISALKVISRTSAMRFKGSEQPISEIAAELGVDAVVSGSVLREGERIGIRAQLIEASSEQNIWAESYERDVTSILALQREIAQAIANEIQITLTQGEVDHLAARSEIDTAAYEAYLKGRFHLQRFTPQDLDRAQQYFEVALTIDPDYALAHWGRGSVWGYRMQAGITRPLEGAPHHRAAILKALELDDHLAEVQTGLAISNTWSEWDWEAGEEAFQRAIELNPNYAEARVFYSHLLAILGRAEQSTAQIDEALRLDPLNPFYQALYGVQLQMIGRNEDAIAIFQESIAAAPGLGFGYFPLAGALFEAGRYEESLEALKGGMAVIGDQEAVAALERGYTQGGFQFAMMEAAGMMSQRAEIMYVKPTSIADLYDYAGETDRVLDWLEKAYEQHDPGMPYLNALPPTLEVLADSRYESLLKMLDLPRIH